MKKILSLILALSLLVGLVPATFAVAKAASVPEEYEFKFINDAHTATADIAKDKVCSFEVSGRESYHKIADTDTAVSSKWGYVAQSFPHTIANTGTEETQIRASFYRPGKKAANSVTFAPDSDETATALCLEIEITEKGTYSPTLNYTAHPQGPIVELYLVPKDDTITDGASLSAYVKNLSPKYRIGFVDAYAAKQDSTAFKTMRATTLNAGSYYLIMIPNGECAAAAEYSQTNNKTFHYFLPQALKLAPPTEPESYTYDFTTDVLTAGAETSVEDAVVTAGTKYDGTFNKLTAFGNSPTVDSTKTEKWSVANTRYVANKPNETICSEINENGLELLLLKMRYYDSDATDNNYATTNDPEENWNAGHCTHVALVIDVPEAGKYNLGIYNNISHTYGGFTQVSVGKASATTFNYNNVESYYHTAADKQTLGWHDSSTVHNGSAQNPAEKFSVTFPAAGSYWVIFATPDGTLDRNDELKNDFQTFNLTRITLEETVVTGGDAEVNVDPGNSEADVSGVGTTPTINTLAADVFGTPLTVEGIDKSDSYVSAPKTFGNYEFLYWTKDIGYNKKIVSHNEKYDFIATPGRTIFTAVYREIGVDTPEKAVFYNANGDIVSTVAIADGAVVAPALTSMAGFGASVGWKLVSTGEIYGAGESVPANGEMLFVAEYNTLSANISVTVNGGSGTGTYTYGDTVTASAPSRKTVGSTEVFNYWTKTVGSKTEIVSFKKDYTFSAWETCTLTAVYSDYVPVAEKVRKVLLSSVMIGGEETVVAEFIGFEDAVERGIAFGTGDAAPSYASLKRSVMNSKDLNQLAVINDEGYSYKAYVITEDGEVHYSK